MTAIKIYEDYKAGLISPEEAAYRIKVWENDQTYETTKASLLKSELIEKLQNFNEEMPDGYKGLRVQIRSGRTTWNFKDIKEVAEAKSTVKNLEEKYKAAYLSLDKGVIPVDEETGEIIQIPTRTYGKPSLVLTLDK